MGYYKLNNVTDLQYSQTSQKLTEDTQTTLILKAAFFLFKNEVVVGLEKLSPSTLVGYWIFSFLKKACFNLREFIKCNIFKRKEFLLNSKSYYIHKIIYMYLIINKTQLCPLCCLSLLSWLVLQCSSSLQLL